MPPVVTVFDDVAAFARIARPFLLRHEAVNILPLHILLGLETGGRGDAWLGLMTAAGNPSEVVAVGIRTPPRDLVLAFPCPAVDPFVQACQAQPLPGILGIAPIAKAFAMAWSRQKSVRAAIAIQLRVFELRHVQFFGTADGELRAAADTDAGLLAAWKAAVTAQAIPSDTPRIDHHHMDVSNYYLWVHQDHPVSCLTGARSSPHGATIRGVYTPPEHRGRGFATAAVATLSQRLLDHGYHSCFLFTDQANATSNRIYTRIGYEPQEELLQYQFHPLTCPTVPAPAHGG